MRFEYGQIFKTHTLTLACLLKYHLLSSYEDGFLITIAMSRRRSGKLSAFAEYIYIHFVCTVSSNNYLQLPRSIISTLFLHSVCQSAAIYKLPFKAYYMETLGFWMKIPKIIWEKTPFYLLIGLECGVLLLLFYWKELRFLILIEMILIRQSLNYGRETELVLPTEYGRLRITWECVECASVEVE